MTRHISNMGMPFISLFMVKPRNINEFTFSVNVMFIHSSGYVMNVHLYEKSLI